MKIRKEWLKIFLGDSNCTLCHTFMIHSLGILFNPNLNVRIFVTVVVQFNIEFKWLSSRELCHCPWRTVVCLAKPIAKSETNSNSPRQLNISLFFLPRPGAKQNEWVSRKMSCFEQSALKLKLKIIFFNKKWSPKLIFLNEKWFLT